MSSLGLRKCCEEGAEARRGEERRGEEKERGEEKGGEKRRGGVGGEDKGEKSLRAFDTWCLLSAWRLRV